MKFSFIKNLLGGKPKRPTRLLAITPPRREERSLLGVENLLGSIAIPEPFSLEIAGDAEGVTLLARFREGSYVEQQLGVHYPRPGSTRCPRRTTRCGCGMGSGPGPWTCASRGRSTCPCAPSRTTSCWSRAPPPDLRHRLPLRPETG